MSQNVLHPYVRSLKQHTGVPVAAFCTVMGFIAGARRDGDWLLGGLLGAAILSIFWVPVFWTAWILREVGDDEA